MDIYPQFKCPTCTGYIPNNAVPGAYPGALSRVDNKTEICSACGEREAMQSWSQQVHRHVREEDYLLGARDAIDAVVARMEKRLCFEGYECEEERCKTVMAFIDMAKAGMADEEA